MYIILTCTLEYIESEIYSPLLLIKTAQRSSQHCSRLHNQVRNVLHNKTYEKLNFLLRFGFDKQAKNRAYICNRVLKLLVKLLVERFHQHGKQKLFRKKCNIIIVDF